jgi:hypothetical protein
MSRCQPWARCCRCAASAVEIVGRLFAGLGAGVVSEVASCECGAGCWLELLLVSIGGGAFAVAGGQ